MQTVRLFINLSIHQIGGISVCPLKVMDNQMKTDSLVEKVRITYEFFFSGEGNEPIVCSKQFCLKRQQKLPQIQQIQQNEEVTLGIADSLFKDQSTEALAQPFVPITKIQINEKKRRRKASKAMLNEKQNGKQTKLKDFFNKQTNTHQQKTGKIQKKKRKQRTLDQFYSKTEK